MPRAADETGSASSANDESSSSITDTTFIKPGCYMYIYSFRRFSEITLVAGRFRDTSCF